MTTLEDTQFEAAKAAAEASGYRVVRDDMQVRLYRGGLIKATFHLTNFIEEHEFHELNERKKASG